MNNAIMKMAGSPLDFLMGMTARTPKNGASPAGDFAGLMGFPPGLQNLSAGVPDIAGLFMSGQTNGPDGRPEILRNIPVLISRNLLLPPDLDVVPKSNEAAPMMVGQPPQNDSMLRMNAALLPVNKGDEQMLYLQLTPGDDLPSGEGILPKGQGNAEEMILPLQLRTVEQSGGRIIADAELLSAAGKGTSVRLQLDLTGVTDGKTDLWPKPLAGGMELSSASGEKINLPRLMGDLGVTQVTISDYSTPNSMTSSTVLPAVSEMLNGNAQFKVGGEVSPNRDMQLPGLTATANMAVSMNPLTAISEQEITGDGGQSVDESPDAFFGGGKNFTRDNIFTHIDDNTGFKIADFNTAFVAGRETIKGEPIETDKIHLRYLDLDNKLQQLKTGPGQRIRIQLVPPQLGKMEISITSHRGMVTVNLGVDSVQAQRALGQNLSQLEQSLASAGIKVDNFQIHLNQQRGETHFQQQFSWQHGAYDGRRGQGGFYRRLFERSYNPQPEIQNGFQQAMINCLA